MASEKGKTMTKEKEKKALQDQVTHLMKQLADLLENRNNDYAMVGAACGILMRNGFTNASVEIAEHAKKILARFSNAQVRAETAEASANRVCKWTKTTFAFATQCGTSRIYLENFCPYCGGRIEEVKAAVPAQVAPEGSTPNTSAQGCEAYPDAGCSVSESKGETR